MSILSKMKIVAFGLLGAVMFFAVGNNVLAMGTPDEETPAEEIVCDGLSGASFGLCNAYCEAMDCDSGFPSASQAACDKVAANFAKHSDGAPFPCEEVGVECPCVTQELWANIGTPVIPTDTCDLQYTLGIGGGILCDVTSNTTECRYQQNSTFEFFILGLSSQAAPRLDTCIYIPFFGPPNTQSLPVTPDEAQACADVLDSRCF